MDWCLIPALTPGPLGLFDQGAPNFTTLLGDTPGPLGMNDAHDPSMSPFGSALDYAVFISQDTIHRALENDSERDCLLVALGVFVSCRQFFRNYSW